MINKLFYLSRKIFLIFLGIFVLLAGIELGYSGYYMYTHDGWRIAKEQSTKSRCQLYGDQPIDEYFHEYTVKKGDSLLTIAASELGNSERVYELSAYAHQPLYYTLEVGTKMRLPRKDLGPVPSIFKRKSGIILYYQYPSITISENEAGTIVDSRFYSTRTRLIGKPEFARGDCVNILYTDDKTLAIELQK